MSVMRFFSITMTVVAVCYSAHAETPKSFAEQGIRHIDLTPILVINTEEKWDKFYEDFTHYIAYVIDQLYGLNIIGATGFHEYKNALEGARGILSPKNKDSWKRKAYTWMYLLVAKHYFSSFNEDESHNEIKHALISLASHPEALVYSRERGEMGIFDWAVSFDGGESPAPMGLAPWMVILRAVAEVRGDGTKMNEILMLNNGDPNETKKLTREEASALVCSLDITSWATIKNNFDKVLNWLEYRSWDWGLDTTWECFWPNFTLNEFNGRLIEILDLMGAHHA